MAKSEPLRSVKAYFSPGLDCVNTVVGFMDRARKTLDCAVYSINHPDIVDALLRAHARGIKGGNGGAIRILTDETQAAGPASIPSIKKLMAAGLDVRTDTESGYMHDKYSLADFGTKAAAVITGSFNWTKHAVKANRENLVRIRVKACIEQFQENFELIWAKNTTKRAIKLGNSRASARK